MQADERIQKPRWLKVKLPGSPEFIKVKKLVEQSHLHTVCQSAKCPNIGECWSRRTATFMIMGDVCTRNCRFCAVDGGVPQVLDADEPQRVAEAVKTLQLKYAVITSVTRDDLDDGGAAHFANVIQAVRQKVPRCKIEVLIPDFQGNEQDLKTVLAAEPDVLNHNIETVPRLYPQARPMANYNQSLQLLQRASQYGAVAKSGLMVGLGETAAEVHQTLQDLVDHGCSMLTIGQYLQPSTKHLPVERFVTPEEFAEYKELGLKMGFAHIESAPLVRSSYHADQQFEGNHGN